MENQKKNKRSTQDLAWLLILVFCSGLFSPNISLASGGGPTQPEVQSFTPIGLSEMVDPFTGDFSYNIPLMDIEGYPINIGYSSGISMDQEASWVGLGWNLNVGSVLRSMRGLPDDFNGDEITKITSQKPQIDLSLGVAVGDIEIFGGDLSEAISEVIGAEEGSMGISLGANLKYNNYTGWGSEMDFGTSFELKGLNRSAGLDLDFSASSENGAGFAPSFSMSKFVDHNDDPETNINTEIGGAMNSTDPFYSDPDYDFLVHHMNLV